MRFGTRSGWWSRSTGYRYHGTRATFERDRRKDADLMLAGYRVLRITWRRLVREREAVIALLATALRP